MNTVLAPEEPLALDRRSKRSDGTQMLVIWSSVEFVPQGDTGNAQQAAGIGDRFHERDLNFRWFGRLGRIYFVF